LLLVWLLPEEVTEDGDNGAVEDGCRGAVGMLDDNIVLVLLTPAGAAFGGLGGKLLLLPLMVVILSQRDWCDSLLRNGGYNGFYRKKPMPKKPLLSQSLLRHRWNDERIFLDEFPGMGQDSIVFFLKGLPIVLVG
jgi:hypothetical protein